MAGEKLNIEASQLNLALLANRNWFLNSGILDPVDGSYGVAERVLLLENNKTAKDSMDAFPAWKFFDGGCVLEQRRADCCFQVAYYFLLLHEYFGNPQDKTIAKNLLEYLYNRSALLSRNPDYTNCPVGVWNWSNLLWTHNIWLDDNAWCIILALKIAERQPDWDRCYRMTEYAQLGASAMESCFQSACSMRQKSELWRGNISQPHWGALAAGALAMSAGKSDRRSKIATDYFTYVDGNLSTFNASETAYALLGAGIAGYLPDMPDGWLNRLTERLLAFIKENNGCPPASHSEAPVGTTLCDLIYTVNFTLLALEILPDDVCNQEVIQAKECLLALLLRIQDQTDLPHLKGCWRGMYDLQNECWGGGDCFEGGASSIYSGWTNAPIGWSLLNEAGIKW